MSYASLADCIADLEGAGLLRRIKQEVDPDLEMARIHRQTFRERGPALLFEKVAGSPFPAVSNLFGTEERYRYMFRHSFERVKRAVELKADPIQVLRNPWRYWQAPFTGITSLPRRVRHASVLMKETTIDKLPGIKSWPQDGGRFITLPQVFTLDPEGRSIMQSNLGMYRIQLSGNEYKTNEEIGLHYQIHRSIGVHHAKAIARNESLKVSIFVGGPPAHTVAAVMPMPENMSELVFAGMLAKRRFRYALRDGHVISADADFCIVGTIDSDKTLPEGPFGDHLGYYSLQHDFPVMRVEKVYHREDAVWPFTVVGRPPQEDTAFGEMIHELTAPMVPAQIPGLKSMHAVDAAGVHPLLLAIGSERYVPYARERQPQEILTIANAILGFNQASLAKYLMICAEEDDTDLNIDDTDAFLAHILERIDWRRDLHFQTKTTMDTLDYSAEGLNEGSKLVIAAAGKSRRRLSSDIPDLSLPPEYPRTDVVRAGVLAIQGPKFENYDTSQIQLQALCESIPRELVDRIPLIILCDDSEFVSDNLSNFLWVCFTRSNPSHDVYGVASFQEFKHWGCKGPLIIDARLKPHHAPPLEED